MTFLGDSGGSVLALDPTTGTELWHREVSGSSYGEWGFYGPQPMVFGSTVVLAGFGGSEDGQNLGVAFGFDTQTGRSAWAAGTDRMVVLDTPAWMSGAVVMVRGIAIDETASAHVCAFGVPGNGVDAKSTSR